MPDVRGRGPDEGRPQQHNNNADDQVGQHADASDDDSDATVEKQTVSSRSSSIEPKAELGPASCSNEPLGPPSVSAPQHQEMQLDTAHPFAFPVTCTFPFGTQTRPQQRQESLAPQRSPPAPPARQLTASPAQHSSSSTSSSGAARIMMARLSGQPIVPMDPSLKFASASGLSTLLSSREFIYVDIRSRTLPKQAAPRMPSPSSHPPHEMSLVHHPSSSSLSDLSDSNTLHDASPAPVASTSRSSASPAHPSKPPSSDVDEGEGRIGSAPVHAATTAGAKSRAKGSKVSAMKRKTGPAGRGKKDVAADAQEQASSPAAASATSAAEVAGPKPQRGSPTMQPAPARKSASPAFRCSAFHWG